MANQKQNRSSMIMMTAMQRPVTKRIVLFDFSLQAHLHAKSIINNKYIEAINDLGKKVYDLLETYVHLFGVQNIFILSHQSNEYVQQSAQCLSKHVQKDNVDRNYWQDICSVFICSNSESSITIISAESINQARNEKEIIFKQLVISHFELNQALTHNNNTNYVIISIGDSVDGFNAAIEVQEMMESHFEINRRNIRLNRFRLRKKASLSVLHNEMSLVKDVAKPWYEAKVDSVVSYDEVMKRFTEVSKVREEVKTWKKRLGKIGLL